MQHRGIITCALRFSVFFTVPLFADPTWYASDGPMIYALVEPSIYMIASILPTTRHLYRRVCREVRQAVQLRSANSNGDPEISSRLSQSAYLERIENSDNSSCGVPRRVDIWQANTNPSQEELTLGECYENRQEWAQARTAHHRVHQKRILPRAVGSRDIRRNWQQKTRLCLALASLLLYGAVHRKMSWLWSGQRSLLIDR
jgi:hypothetical protein